jgi:hypothetical protein
MRCLTSWWLCCSTWGAELRHDSSQCVGSWLQKPFPGVAPLAVQHFPQRSVLPFDSILDCPALGDATAGTKG